MPVLFLLFAAKTGPGERTLLLNAYIIRKLIALPIILIGVSFLIFIAVRALPGDPARLMAGADATEAALEGVRIRLGLDQPVLIQYGYFIANALQGDLGLSLRSKIPVTQEISERFPNTLTLAIVSYVFAILIGVTAGVVAAAN